jgi:hypothetical protein
MLKRRLRAPSPAFVISLIALFVALGGTTYAATGLPKNSVGTKQLKKNAVTGPKIKKGAVTAAKINTRGLTVPNALHATSADSATSATNATHATSADTATNATNATHATSATNATNAANAQPTAFARISSAGAIDSANSKNVGHVTVAGTTPAGPFYCLSGIPFTPKGAQVTIDYTDSAEDAAQVGMGANGSCPAGTQIWVSPRAYDGSGGASAGFFIEVYG